MEALVAYFVLFIVIATLWSFIVAAKAADRRRVGFAQAWSRYAARSRYEFVAGTTPERAFFIRGLRDGVAFTLETFARERVVTRLRVPAPFAVEGRLAVVLGQARGRDAKTPRASTGDAHFDRLFDVRATSPGAAAAALGVDVRRALQRFPAPMMGQALRLTIEDGELVVEWQGGEVDVTSVDAAHAVVREVCARGAPGKAA